MACCFSRYLIRPSPFSAQKTFERHNSRRRSHINICEERRRRNSTKPLPQKANSLSLPDSPDISHTNAAQLGANRARSASLRVDDILMRRSSSLRQGLIQRNTSSVEEVSICVEPSRGGFRGSIKIPLNGSIGLEVTPPDAHQNQSSHVSLSDSEDSLEYRGTIVWHKGPPVVNKTAQTQAKSQPLPTPTIFVCESDD